MEVRLISTTKGVNGETGEEIISYCARVSSPENQTNYDTSAKLLKYCMKHGHWSVFEMADMCVEIKTSRAIAAQILRHHSMCFQEFSQRYSKVSLDNGLEIYKARRQDSKNRQNSIDDLSPAVQKYFEVVQDIVWSICYGFYEKLLALGVAKECARMILPLNTRTVLYVKGTCRSWIHYLQVRCAKGVQEEHKEIALKIRDEIFSKEFPNIYEAMLE